MIVWVQLPALKIHFYHKEVLTTLGNLIGRMIKLDFHTLNRQRAKFARMAVEVDLSKHLVPRICLDDAWQKVEYENLPAVCFDCGKIGHTETGCPHRQIASPTTTLAIAGEAAVAEQSDQAVDEPNPGFGPWMLVTRKSRRNQRDADRKGNIGILGKSAPAGKGTATANKESGSQQPSTALPSSSRPQRSLSQERKTHGKNKLDDGRKGKAKISNAVTIGGKGLLGSGPTPHQPMQGPSNSAAAQDPTPTSTHSQQPPSRIINDPSTSSSPAHHSSSTSQSLNLPPPPAFQTVIGPNGTVMQIAHPQSDDAPRNRNDRQASPTTSARTKRSKGKKTTSRKLPNKPSPVKALQIWSPKKDRKPKSKARLAVLTLQEINAWTSAAQAPKESSDEAPKISPVEESTSVKSLPGGPNNHTP
ncbi:unnamed protein product [Linum trigynum]|uniref:CCHC-type domain-containing protein n=1 Tax=Linum trigynum TaxID=586398 RepID=A0AAV2DEG4_9ROSI